MKLVLISGGYYEDNSDLFAEMIRMSEINCPTFTFIPSEHYNSATEFKNFVDVLRKLGIKRVILFPLDVDYDQLLLERAISSDIIFLGGGNTFYFLHMIRKKKLVGTLKNFVDKGGVLAGESAGAIIQTPNIMTASIPDFDCDDNDINLKNYKGLSLVSFEFFPHYQNSRRYNIELANYSRTIKTPLFAVGDNGGIAIDDDEKMVFFGSVNGFFNGHRYRISG